ncbi:transmembrane protein, putative (macronuclear) [Tetrahymena thermophila SB210]|uniref:Transmembrane protein, putative n=1 Tax=Tetrahymena thermophila (strain SB210) TaxID=312017 RepID=Q24I88_TETTS|nr:transmembrane protein, putative [Tetrahymena thermophila SB210]EAS07509.2 transmembrane protein, putative [Tetrahymena thermophila SB210]|eukprot:XP_001027751.2 transmembrane protein, putative [Tetrahymena thermophila SB210]
MSRQTKKKKQIHGKSSSEESSQSESSESQSSESESSESENSRQQRRGTQKKNTQVRKLTQRKPTQALRKQGTLTHIGKSGRSQEDIKDDDDFNLPQQRGGGRKQTQVRGSDTTAPEIKRSNQRGMTKIQAQNLISNLENELVLEKTKQEQLQKEKEEQDMLVRNEVQHLNQEKLLLLRKADQKKTHIQTIQKKLEEQKQNNVDIISTKKSKSTGGILSTLQSINQFFFDNYLLSSYCYQMANYFDNKVYEHFAFISYFYNSSLLAFFILLYLLINQIVSNHSNYSNISLFFSFTFDGNVPAFVLLCLLFLISQIIIAFIKFDKYKCKRVREVARYTSKINFFKLVISDYNWKIKNRTQLEKVQLAFQLRASFLLQIQSTRNKFQAKENDYSVYVFQFFGFVLSCGIVVAQILGIQFILQDGRTNIGSNQNLNMFIQSVICSAFCLIGSSLTQVFHSFEQLKGLFYKQLRYYLIQIIPCCYFLFVKTLVLFENKYSIPSFINVESFMGSNYSCPNEQLGYELIIFMLTYSLVAILYTYIQILVQYIFKKCKDRGRESKNSLAMKYFYYVRFRSCQQTIPFLIVFFLMICIIPLNPFIIIVNFFVFAFIFLHNFLQAKRFFLPQFDNFSSTMIKGMMIKLLAISLFLGLIYQIILFSLEYDLGFFVKNGNVVNCGPFERGQTGINKIWDNLGSFSEFLLVITWKPIILFLLALFILISISSANQIDEWQKQYQEKDNELKAIRRFYSKEVTNLEDKINYAQKNIENIVEEDVQQIQLESDNKPQRLSNGLISPDAEKIPMVRSIGHINGSAQNIGNGSLISTFIQNNKENDSLIQNLNQHNNNYHSRNGSMAFNIPQKQSTQYLTTTIGTPYSQINNNNKQDSPLKVNQLGNNSPSPIVVNTGPKSIFNSNLLKKN